MRILILIFLCVHFWACSNVNSQAIQYREVHVEKQNHLLQISHANEVDVTAKAKLINIEHQLSYDFFYDKPVG